VSTHDPRERDDRPRADAEREGGEMAHDPRGGWQFATPADERAHGADAPPPPLAVPDEPDPSVRPESTDPERLRFQGDPQHPPQSFAHGGTQGTWDQSLGASPVPEPPARLPAAPGEATASPPVPHTFLPHTPAAKPATGPHDRVIASPEGPEALEGLATVPHDR
jgi:hypothetical protein